MSISLADALPTTLPAGAASVAAPMDASALMLWICLGWALVGILAGIFFGVFRRNSIVGPERLAPTESAWDLLIVFFIVYYGGLLATVGISNLMHLHPGARMLLLYSGNGLASFVAVILLLRRIRPGSVRLLGLDPARLPGGLVTGSATVFIMYPLIQLTSGCVELIYDHFHLTKAKPHEILQLLGSSENRRLTVIAVVLACVIAPLAEELLYRGLLQTMFVRLYSWMAGHSAASVIGGELQSTLPLEYQSALMPISSSSAGVRWAAVLTSSAIFAAVHVEPAFLAPLFVLALGLGYVYERTGNLWVTITAHAIFNTLQILLYLAAGR
jgi:membrane protease YdiL (CAAX protease family)